MEEKAVPARRFVAGLAACAVLGWFAFVRGAAVPLLSAADLGFHELGHMLFAWAPDKLAAFMGSGMQILVPLGLAAYFAFARRDRLAAALMLAWASTSLQNVSVYIADAPYERLELLGNGTHDWAFLLGAEGWNVLGASGLIARLVWLAGLAALLAAVAVCADRIVRQSLARRREIEAARHVAQLAVHAPLNTPAVPALEPDEASGQTSR